MIAVTEWMEIAVATPEGADPEEIAARIAALAPITQSGAEIREHEVVFWVDRAQAGAALDDVRRAAGQLASEGHPVTPAGVSARAAVPESEWRDAWKRLFRAARLTHRIVVAPSWDPHQEGEDDDIVIHLDPGQAFGTGAHASTQLCLTELQHLADTERTPRRVLDLGTGSGLLAVAAAKLWPEAEILAVDNDPEALAAAADNGVKNDVHHRIKVAAEVSGDGQFDVCVANIQADVLVSLAENLASWTAPGGVVVLSGILAPQADTVAAAYTHQGLELVAIRTTSVDPEWRAVVLRKSS